jgi:hypothetical protein
MLGDVGDPELIFSAVELAVHEVIRGDDTAETFDARRPALPVTHRSRLWSVPQSRRDRSGPDGLSCSGRPR